MLVAITSGVAQPASADAPEVREPVAVTAVITDLHHGHGHVLVPVPEHEKPHVDPPEVEVPGPPAPPFAGMSRPVRAPYVPPRRGRSQGSLPPLVSQPALPPQPPRRSGPSRAQIAMASCGRGRTTQFVPPVRPAA
jgi:hypothetical protein